MSRLRRIEQRDRYFFVTTNLARGVAELTPPERTIVLNELDALRRNKAFLLFGYVVMPTHAHFLLWPHGSDLTDLLREFKSKSALRLAHERKLRGAVWQPRFFDFICWRAHDFHERAEYIHNNPVQARLVDGPQDWLWSSAGWYLDRLPAPIPVDTANLPADRNALLWPAPWP